MLMPAVAANSSKLLGARRFRATQLLSARSSSDALFTGTGPATGTRPPPVPGAAAAGSSASGRFVAAPTPLPVSLRQPTPINPTAHSMHTQRILFAIAVMVLVLLFRSVNPTKCYNPVSPPATSGLPGSIGAVFLKFEI